MMQRILLLLVISLTFTTANLSCNSKSGKRNTVVTDDASANSHNYLEVSKVVDGDTFWADDGSKKGIKVRLIGVDAPESRKVFKKEVGYYGKEAKEYLQKMLDGRKVKLVCDVDSLDRFGRTLAYVYLVDGTFINAELVKNGYAMVMTVPPNIKYAHAFLEFQQKARDNNLGLWGENR